MSVTSVPKKAKFRQRAHCNPLSAVGYAYPKSPEHVDWSLHYPAVFGKADDALHLNTTATPITYSETPVASHLNGKAGVSPTILDIGCGFGGLLFALAKEYPEKLCLGLEIRDRVTQYVGEKINAVRQGLISLNDAIISDHVGDYSACRSDENILLAENISGATLGGEDASVSSGGDKASGDPTSAGHDTMSETHCCGAVTGSSDMAPNGGTVAGGTVAGNTVTGNAVAGGAVAGGCHKVIPGGGTNAEICKTDAESRSLVPGSGQNIAVLRTNVMKYSLNYFNKRSVELMFILFPDPHFKKSNWRRRIITPQLLTLYAYLLKKDGLIFIDTDYAPLYLWMHHSFQKHPLFRKVAGKIIFGGDPSSAARGVGKSISPNKTSLAQGASDVANEEAAKEHGQGSTNRLDQAPETALFPQGVGQWHLSLATDEDDFVRYVDSDDPSVDWDLVKKCIRLVHRTTEEGKKATRNGETHHIGVYQCMQAKPFAAAQLPNSSVQWMARST